jgi:hypothetical protein
VAAMPIRPPEIRKLDFSAGYQYYTFWSPSAVKRSANENIERARCSHCMAETKHLLLEKLFARRNVFECASGLILSGEGVTGISGTPSHPHPYSFTYKLPTSSPTL